MSKDNHRTIAVSSHVRRAPTRVVVVPSPSIEEPRPPSLPCVTSPTQESAYDSYPNFSRDTMTREYRDTIVDREIGSDDDGDGEY